MGFVSFAFAPFVDIVMPGPREWCFRIYTGRQSSFSRSGCQPRTGGGVNRGGAAPQGGGPDAAVGS